MGGIGNISLLLHGGGGKPLKGYDTGPANTLLDAWIEKHQRKEYDKDGEWASQGKLIPELLEEMLKEPFFAKK